MEPKAPLANCSECPLKDERFVPSLIPEGRPRLAVVGEAPGFQETAYGEPFKGPSGKLLDKVLNHHGFQRKEVLYTNVCLCRPEDNATPPAAAQSACRQRLIHELADSGVQDVVALGGTAVGALVDDPRTITTLRVGPPRYLPELLGVATFKELSRRGTQLTVYEMRMRFQRWSLT